MLRTVIDRQVRLSRRIDRCLPERFHRDGHKHYIEQVTPRYLRPGIRVYDVGGGKRPYLAPETKAALGAYVVGIDIDPNELASAPEGSFDRAVASDIAEYAGCGDADLIICQAVFEHVRNVEGATAALASILKPGGVALLFVPCRNALFARLNLLMPQAVKRAVLFAIFPGTRTYQGFPSFYDHCTPSALTQLARKSGLEVESVTPYWLSDYFHAFLPAYAVWRLWSIVAATVGLTNYCETFTIVLRKPPLSALDTI